MIFENCCNPVLMMSKLLLLITIQQNEREVSMPYHSLEFNKLIQEFIEDRTPFHNSVYVMKTLMQYDFSTSLFP